MKVAFLEEAVLESNFFNIVLIYEKDGLQVF